MFGFDAYHVLFAAVGAGIIFAYWLPRFVSGREPAASALLIAAGALAFGVLPGMPDAIDPTEAPVPWERLSELCLIVGLFGAGLRLDRFPSARQWRASVRLLAIAMPLTIAAVAFLGGAFAGLTLAAAILLGAILAPTDPVLAGDVQVGPPNEGGEHPVRTTLTTEAGLNDGLAFPFVHLGLLLAGAGALSADLLGVWLARDVLFRVAMGAAAGVATGLLLGRTLFAWPRDNPLADTQTGVVAFAGVLFAYGATELLEGYGFIASFVTGLVLRRAETRHDFHRRLHDFTETLEHALTAMLLIGLGAALPALLPHLGWREAAIGVGLVFLIRPLIAWASLMRLGLRTRERLVMSFYGVRGIGSIYYLAYAGAHVELVNESRLWAIVAFTILLSTLVHGLTAGAVIERVAKDPSS